MVVGCDDGHVAAVVVDEYQLALLAARLHEVTARAQEGVVLSPKDHVILMRAWKVSAAIPEDRVALLKKVAKAERRG